MALFVIRGRHLTTVHEPGAKLNDINPGWYWQVLFVAWGYYRNSHSTKDKNLISRWFGLAINLFGTTYSFGIVSGYPDSWLLPYFSRSEVFRAGRIRFRLFFIPETVLNGSAVHSSAEMEKTLAELWADFRLTVKKKDTAVPGPSLGDELAHEFRDSRIADFVHIDIIDRR